MAKRPAELRAEWDALKQEAAALAVGAASRHGLPADHPDVEAHERRIAMLAVQKDKLAAAAWLGTARDVVDVLLLAEIVWDLFWGLGTFPQLPADIENRDQREVAVAYLIRGVWEAYSQAQAASPQEGETP
jgi:hypothetical protein